MRKRYLSYKRRLYSWDMSTLVPGKWAGDDIKFWEVMDAFRDIIWMIPFWAVDAICEFWPEMDNTDFWDLRGVYYFELKQWKVSKKRHEAECFYASEDAPSPRATKDARALSTRGPTPHGVVPQNRREESVEENRREKRIGRECLACTEGRYMKSRDTSHNIAVGLMAECSNPRCNDAIYINATSAHVEDEDYDN